MEADSAQQQINASEHEVLECKWFSVEDYLATQPSKLLTFLIDQYKKYLESGNFIDMTRRPNIRKKEQRDAVYFSTGGQSSNTIHTNTTTTSNASS